MQLSWVILTRTLSESPILISENSVTKLSIDDVDGLSTTIEIILNNHLLSNSKIISFP